MTPLADNILAMISNLSEEEQKAIKSTLVIREKPRKKRVVVTEEQADRNIRMFIRSIQEKNS